MSDTGSPDLASKHAWRDLPKRGLPKRSGTERAADFLEIYGLYDETAAREQASRCIQCPNPSCVTGCPLCNPIPQWMQLTAEGRFLEAAAVLGSVTNMAEICARLCPTEHLCEGACLLDSVSEPVAIGALEQFLVEYAFAHGQVDVSTAPPNGLKVAVVGSGPGGLACAEDLARKGYAVTVFDSELVPGGLLVNGVPAFKLDRSLIARRIDILRRRGVVFQLGVRLWSEVRLAQLRAEHHAVFLAMDARRARPLEIPGADLDGVVPAVVFLLQKGTPLVLDTQHLDIAGTRVAVIGCGDTAMDCLRTAIRYGVREAICIYRREEADVPCGRKEYANALEEGARFLFRSAPVAVLGNENGRVRALRLVETEVDASAADRRRLFRPQPGTEHDLEVDWVIPALGFDPAPCPAEPDFEQLALNDWGGIRVDERLMTTVPGVFAGGDLVSGPSMILHVVRDARRAAAQIDAYLSAR